jgi:hypothetical protein
MTVMLHVAAGMAPANGPSRAARLLPALAVTYPGRLTRFSAIREPGGGQPALLMPLEILLSVLWSFLLLGAWLSTSLAMQRAGPDRLV